MDLFMTLPQLSLSPVQSYWDLRLAPAGHTACPHPSPPKGRLTWPDAACTVLLQHHPVASLPCPVVLVLCGVCSCVDRVCGSALVTWSGSVGVCVHDAYLPDTGMASCCLSLAF